jgi:serine/threonine protein phosphatase PrpC
MKKGGRVHPYRDLSGQALGPARVWLPNQSIMSIILDIQGLAMSRSFGDNISKSIGVIHNPEMIKVALDENSKFLLLASDGVW